MLDHQGQPILKDGAPALCPAPDYNGVLLQGMHSWLFTHEECGPAGLFMTELERDGTGHPFAVQASPVARSSTGGLDQLCSGSVSPWGSLLSGEEYETDAALLSKGRMPSAVQGHRYRDHSAYVRWSRFFGSDLSPEAMPSPYGNGQVVETSLDDDGQAELAKHPAMGRFSHEVVLSMPDQRTVYMTDDQSHAGLFMFLADTEQELSAGTLYAARWTRTDDGYDLAWISLGHATDGEIRAALDAGVRFDQLFERQALEGGHCREGLLRQREPSLADVCLAVLPGQQVLASRLESRRYAALAGATTELEKQEGLAIDVHDRRLFVAFTRIDGGMLAGDPPWPGQDHVALPRNACGAIWTLSMPGGAAQDTQRKRHPQHLGRDECPAPDPGTTHGCRRQGPLRRGWRVQPRQSGLDAHGR